MKQFIISLLTVFVMTNTFVTSVFADNEPIACDGVVRNYVSATGTVIQNGTPTPENPIEPIFYTQGDMILRAVGDYADSYDATTGKITRRVGVKVLDGTESWAISTTTGYTMDGSTLFWNVGSIQDNLSVGDGIPAIGMSNYFVAAPRAAAIATPKTIWSFSIGSIYHSLHTLWIRANGEKSISEWKQWLAQQYANGTPLTVYYPLATEVVEDWSATTYCAEPIKIATTKFVDEEFAQAEANLAATVQTIESVVSRTIAQTGQIQVLQDTKQTRPDESCPANMKCLLVQDEDGTPHWYPIIEP